MTISRSIINGRFVAAALMVLLALSLTACVSVKESGNQPPAPPAMSSVKFDADRRFAEVYVNGEFRGTAPVNLHLPAGTHVIEFKLQGFQTWKRELVVVAGNDTRVAATLQPE
jgi:hypothetical protein